MLQPGMSLGIPSQQGSGVLGAGRGARDRCPAHPLWPIRGQQRPRDQCGMKELRLRRLQLPSQPSPALWAPAIAN